MVAALSTSQCTNTANSVTSATLAATFPASNTGGDTLVAFVGCFRQSTTGAAALSCTDSAGNTWTAISSAETSSNVTGWMTCQLFYAQNVSGATNTVTSSASLSSCFLSMWIGEISGVSATPLDVSGSTEGNTSRQTHNALTLSTTGEVVVYGISDLAGGTTAYAWSTAAASTGPVSARTEWNVLNGASFQRIGGCSFVGVGPGTVQPTSSFASLSTLWGSLGAAFLAGGAAPAVLRPLFPAMGAGR